LLAAQEGAKELQKAKTQEATKAVKEKADKKKKKKADKSTGRGKAESTKQPSGHARLEIPDFVKESLKKERAKQHKKLKAAAPTTLGMVQVAEKVLPELEPFRSKAPILWDPRELKDPTLEMGAMRELNEDHTRTLTEVIWSQRHQPVQREWIVFQFGVGLVALARL
jgi:hypothetical protein